MSGEYTEIAGQALWLILKLSLAPLLASLIVGLAISLLQALTQVQEQTMTFVPKIIATVLVIIITASWMMQELMDFAQQVFALIPRIGAG